MLWSLKTVPKTRPICCGCNILPPFYRGLYVTHFTKRVATPWCGLVVHRWLVNCQLWRGVCDTGRCTYHLATYSVLDIDALALNRWTRTNWYDSELLSHEGPNQSDLVWLFVGLHSQPCSVACAKSTPSMVGSYRSSTDELKKNFVVVYLYIYKQISTK